MRDASILVGDVGGTNARFAVARTGRDGIALSEIWKRQGADFGTIEAALDAYLGEAKPEFDGAAFGLAGMVEGDRVEVLHRGWMVERESLKARLAVERVTLANDFFAMARSAPDLGPEDLVDIAPGKARAQGSLAVGGPGTGFGVAVLRRIGAGEAPGWVVVGGEGGHQAFSPQTDIEWKLAEELRQSVGYVSNELVASGSGFAESWEAVCHVMGAAPRKLAQSEVIERAKAGEGVALEFCRIRARCVMTAMGDMALAAGAVGGVFLAGGVTVRLEPWLRERGAMDRLRRRGPRTGLMTPIPVKLITSEAAPLIGAAKLWLDEQERGWL